jgi:signal transduction histidine kinase/CheY-like chemotaxis protein
MASTEGVLKPSTVPPSLVAEAGAEPSAQLIVLREWVASLFSYLPTTLAGNTAGFVVLSILYWNEAPRSLTLGWIAAAAVLGFTRLWMLLRFRRTQPHSAEVSQRWLLIWNMATLYSGTLWGASAWIFYGYGGATEKIGLLLVVYSFCVAAIPILSPQSRIYNGFVLLCFVPTVIRVGWPLTLDSGVLATVLILIFGSTVLLARDYRMAVENLLRLKTRADLLTEQLRAEKTAAEAARHEAEVANRAKTQFFAAASHDLRQPLHAMGLFAEALRGRSHDEEALQLVTSINGAVDALEGLFSELLDIAKIDTGGLETSHEHFNAGDIFRKLRLHFEPNAFEKGLSLRFRGEAHNAYSDPVLVERILRNLVSNAIRYTNDGSVLVSCRKRGGRLLFQVWDTGVGIRERERERIFEEFYQVPYNKALSPQQRKGLGLGLAIVRRLSDLIEAPLTLRSEPGRGTVFSLQVPPGKAPRAQAPQVANPAPLGLTLDRQFIVVVEDEPTVRGGLEVLLKAWGASVISFETLAASQAWAEAVDADVPQPSLLIVDYRLEDGRTGLEAIQVLRDRFGKDVPAIMVTGSTMTGHDAQAQAHDFHLLVKPVVPNKLRAMINFKLGVRG